MQKKLNLWHHLWSNLVKTITSHWRGFGPGFALGSDGEVSNEFDTISFFLLNNHSRHGVEIFILVVGRSIAVVFVALERVL